MDSIQFQIKKLETGRANTTARGGNLRMPTNVNDIFSELGTFLEAMHAFVIYGGGVLFALLSSLVEAVS